MHVKDQLRWRIAREAARLIAEEGIHDHFLAKQKASSRMGVASSRNLPRNEEIDAALEEHHRIFRPDRQPAHIRRLRLLASEAMEFLKSYSPRLVGGVAEGWAGAFSPVTLYLFPETREAVLTAMEGGGIPFTEKTVEVSLGSGKPVRQQALCFLADGVEIRLILWPEDARSGGVPRNLAGADREAVEALLRADDEGHAKG